MSEQHFAYPQAQQETEQAARLRGCFPHLSERDLAVILLATPEYAPAILQRCFGSDAAATTKAKAAWNDYVLRYIDGAQSQADSLPGQQDTEFL